MDNKDIKKLIDENIDFKNLSQSEKEEIMDSFPFITTSRIEKVVCFILICIVHMIASFVLPFVHLMWVTPFLSLF